MPKDKGRIDWMPRSKKWKAIGYKGRRDIELGRYTRRDDAVKRLQKFVRTG